MEQSHSVGDTPFCTCQCQSGRKTWMNEKAFKIHCSKTNCRASKRYRHDPEIERQQVLQHQHDLENTSEFVSTIQHSITDSIAVMRYSDNMTHPQIGRSVVQTHNIQVTSLDCVAAILKKYNITLANAGYDRDYGHLERMYIGRSLRKRKSKNETSKRKV